jgi:hypothetical protein
LFLAFDEQSIRYVVLVDVTDIAVAAAVLSVGALARRRAGAIDSYFAPQQLQHLKTGQSAPRLMCRRFSLATRSTARLEAIVSDRNSPQKQGGERRL